MSTTRPLLVLHVVWHPGFADGLRLSEALRDHFRRKLYEDAGGGTGLSVQFRSTPATGSSTPPPIPLDDAETIAIVVLVDEHLVADPEWVSYIAHMSAETERIGLHCRIFTVVFRSEDLRRMPLAEQAVRWDKWMGTRDALTARLISELAYEFCRMLRLVLERAKRPGTPESELGQYLARVQIFLSHSKHDDQGEKLALQIRDFVHQSHGLASFFDFHDIPAGLRAEAVLIHQVQVSAVIAIHSDSYSSREWCRREVIEAKRALVPLVVADCISDIDERGFPYLGNVPVVRLDDSGARISAVISRLLDEVLKDFLWRTRLTIQLRIVDPAVIPIPRAPELIVLAGLPSEADLPNPIVVYPDPPLSAEEERLFEKIAPRVQLRSVTEWIAGAVR